MGAHRARFEALYAAHAPAVRAYVLRRIDPATADDVLSEVFLVAWRRLDEVPAEPRLWLLGTARRVLANQRRSTARWLALHQQLSTDRTTAHTAADLSGGAVDAAHAVDRDLGSAASGAADHGVLRALAALRDTDREALLLIGWDDLKPREAAEVVGIPAPAFSMRLSRARRRFAQLLEDEATRDAAPTNRPTPAEVPHA